MPCKWNYAIWNIVFRVWRIYGSGKKSLKSQEKKKSGKGRHRDDLAYELYSRAYGVTSRKQQNIFTTQEGLFSPMQNVSLIINFVNILINSQRLGRSREHAYFRFSF